MLSMSYFSSELVVLHRQKVAQGHMFHIFCFLGSVVSHACNVSRTNFSTGIQQQYSPAQPLSNSDSLCVLVQEHGGQLCLYPHPNSGNEVDNAVLIGPHGGRLVLFQSNIEHEVLPSFANRCFVHSQDPVLLFEPDGVPFAVSRCCPECQLGGACCG